MAGLLNSGQSFDAQAEPAEVPMDAIATPIVACALACGETGTVLALEDGRVLTWGMRRYFEPTPVPGLEALDGPIASIHCGASRARPAPPRAARPRRPSADRAAPSHAAGSQHIMILTESGRLYSYGKGTALALPKAERKSWELLDVSKHALDERKVLQVAAGSNSTAIIVEA